MQAGKPSSRLVVLTLSSSGMAFDPKSGESFQLNDSARRIIELFQNGLSVEEVAQALAKEFGISYEKALTDVMEFQIQIQLMGVAA